MIHDDKVILTDCDGVLLNWQYAFDCWMEEKGYEKTIKHNRHYHVTDQYNLTILESKKLVRYFQESACIGFLPAHRDAIHYVKIINEKLGYRFTVITSLSKNQYAQKLRKQNLRKLFGEYTFKDFIFLDTGEDKTEALEQYKDSQMYWIEDKAENATIGHKLGLSPMLMEHGYNMNDIHPFPIVKDWKDIYDRISLWQG